MPVLLGTATKTQDLILNHDKSYVADFALGFTSDTLDVWGEVKELENSTFGILCVTKDNLYAPWLSFEAGALSKTMDKSFVTQFLFDISEKECEKTAENEVENA